MASTLVVHQQDPPHLKERKLKSRNFGSIRSRTMNNKGDVKLESHSPIPQTTIKLGGNIEWVPRPLQTPRCKNVDDKDIHGAFWHPMTREQMKLLTERRKKSITPPKSQEKTFRPAPKNICFTKKSKSAPKPQRVNTTSGDFTKYVTTVLRREQSFKDEKRKQSETTGYDLTAELKRNLTPYCWSSKNTRTNNRTKEAPDYLYKFTYQKEYKSENKPFVPQINSRKYISLENADKNSKGTNLPHAVWSEDDSIDLANYMFSGAGNNNKHLFFPHIGDYGPEPNIIPNDFGSGLMIPAGYWTSGLGNRSLTCTGRWSTLAKHKLFPEYDESKTELKSLPSYGVYKDNKTTKHRPIHPVEAGPITFIGPWEKCFAPIFHGNAPPNTANGPRPPRNQIDAEPEPENIPAPPQSRIDNYSRQDDEIPRLRLHHGPKKTINLNMTMAGDMG